MKSPKLLSVLAVAALAGCIGEPAGSDDVQTITGSVKARSFSSPVIGVRVLQDNAVVAHSPVGSDGSFSLEVPEGTGYRVEVVTRDGAYPLGSRHTPGGLRPMAFDVCDALDEYTIPEALEMYDGDWDEGDDGDPTDPPPDGEPPHPDDDGDCGDPPPDPCEADPEWCDPCIKWPELCEPPCDETDPDGCTDPCAEDPSLCDPCIEHPELCEPCEEGTDPDDCWPDDPCDKAPEMCDPCLEWPELCEDPCEIDPEACMCEEGDVPGPDGTCWPPDPCDEDPDACVDPCEEFPEMCDPCRDDPDSCWPPDPECPYDDPACWPEPPECEEGMDPSDPDGDWCWDDEGCWTDEEIPDFGCEADG